MTLYFLIWNGYARVASTGGKGKPSIASARANSSSRSRPTQLYLYWLLRTSIRKRDNLVFHHPPLYLCHVVLSHR